MGPIEPKDAFIRLDPEFAGREATFYLKGQQTVQILPESVSTYCLKFRFSDCLAPFDPDEPLWLILSNNGNSIEVGPCRILPNSGPNDIGDELLLTNTEFDFRRLLLDNKVMRLSARFGQLPLIFEHKTRVRPSFKTYTADLRYDLMVYKQLFDELDSTYQNEPRGVRDAVQLATIETEGRRFRAFFEAKLIELGHLVQDLEPSENQAHGFFFRKQLWDIILGSPFSARCNLKPRGYAGDSGLMRMIYFNDYQGASTFAKLVHKHCVEHAASQSVRNRVGIIAHKLEALKHRYNAARFDGRIKVLSVGCGPALELGNILKTPEDCDIFQFFLLDQDSVALLEAAETVSEIEKRLKVRIHAEYIRHSVRFMVFSRDLHRKWGQFHCIYSLGLFDYLTERIAKAVLVRLYRLLAEGGELVVGNYHVSNPSKFFMDYWGDWPIMHRTEEQFRQLLPDATSKNSAITYDETGIQMFLCTEKFKDEDMS